MTDIHNRDQRRRNMQAIKGKDTKPEMVVRRLVHSMGFRYRLHDNRLSGKPDLTFPRLRKVIFVHGCYWHMHDCRYGKVVPKTNADFWARKRQGNVERDLTVRQLLSDSGWDVLVVWECETKDSYQLSGLLAAFLNSRLSP